VPPHVAEGVGESRALFDLVKTQGRDGAAGIVQGERALSRISHAHGGGERDPYGEGSFAKPYLPGEEDGPPASAGANQGMGSVTQADVTPGEEGTKRA
jgi:hypothetical protein